MEINYLGHSAFKIKGKTVTVVTDPYDERAGKFPKDIEVQILTISHEHSDHNQKEKVKGNPFVIRGPGEYEVGGVSVIGVQTFHDAQNGKERGVNTVYVIEIDGLRIAHLGDLGHKLSQEQLEEMGAIDVVMVPIGGTYTLGPKEAVEVVRQADPWIVIPMHYRFEGETFGMLSGLDDFLKEVGKSETVPIPKLMISGDRLPEDMQVVVLERK
jgi:L-ascorbate metabolism protein UlaG (beta-lactamase superfamily)